MMANVYESKSRSDDAKSAKDLNQVSKTPLKHTFNLSNYKTKYNEPSLVTLRSKSQSKKSFAQ